MWITRPQQQSVRQRPHRQAFQNTHHQCRSTHTHTSFYWLWPYSCVIDSGLSMEEGAPFKNVSTHSSVKWRREKGRRIQSNRFATHNHSRKIGNKQKNGRHTVHIRHSKYSTLLKQHSNLNIDLKANLQKLDNKKVCMKKLAQIHCSTETKTAFAVDGFSWQLCLKTGVLTMATFGDLLHRPSPSVHNQLDHCQNKENRQGLFPMTVTNNYSRKQWTYHTIYNLYGHSIKRVDDNQPLETIK